MEIYSKKIRILEKLVQNQNKLLEEIKNLERTYKNEEITRDIAEATSVITYFLNIRLKFYLNYIFFFSKV